MGCYYYYYDIPKLTSLVVLFITAISIYYYHSFSPLGYSSDYKGIAPQAIFVYSPDTILTLSASTNEPVCKLQASDEDVDQQTTFGLVDGDGFTMSSDGMVYRVEPLAPDGIYNIRVNVLDNGSPPSQVCLHALSSF